MTFLLPTKLDLRPFAHFGILDLKDIELLHESRLDTGEDLMDQVKFFTGDMDKDQLKKQIIRIRSYLRVRQREPHHFPVDYCQEVIYCISELVNTYTEHCFVLLLLISI